MLGDTTRNTAYYATITGSFGIKALRAFLYYAEWSVPVSVLEHNGEAELTLCCNYIPDLLSDVEMLGRILDNKLQKVVIEPDEATMVTRWLDCDNQRHDSIVEACEASLASSGKLFALPSDASETR